MNISIVGLGYVGLPLAVEFALRDHRVFGVDVSSNKVDLLNSGTNYIGDVSDEDLASVVESGRFTATTTFDVCADADAIIICVPTPVTDNKDPDLTAIRVASEGVADFLKAGQTVILKSTTFPTTTEDVVLPILESVSGLRAGTDFNLAYSPERVDPGNTTWTTRNTPIVIGGLTPACTEAARDVLGIVTPNVHLVSSPRVAEMEKLLENIFRSVNIALVNEMARLCDRMGNVSIWEVVEAAATKPFGFMPFYPGPGLGGHCIPIDPYYMSWLARKYDFEASFITLSARTNEDMPFYVVQAVQRVLADRGFQHPDGPKVLLLGVAFKKNVNDMRHSPALKIFSLLEQTTRTEVDYHDPHVPTFRKEWQDGEPEVQGVALDADNLEAYDAVVVVTDHDAIDYELVAKHARFIIDTRHAFSGMDIPADRIRTIGGGHFLDHNA